MEQLHPGWKEVIAREIGPDWRSYPLCNIENIRPSKGICVMRRITDGKVVTKPRQIITADNQVLATLKDGIRIYYLEAKGTLRSIIFPNILRLNNGK
jgi:hypothetical protein